LAEILARINPSSIQGFGADIKALSAPSHRLISRYSLGPTLTAMPLGRSSVQFGSSVQAARRAPIDAAFESGLLQDTSWVDEDRFQLMCPDQCAMNQGICLRLRDRSTVPTLHETLIEIAGCTLSHHSCASHQLASG